MTAPLGQLTEGATETEEWVVIWFPPNRPDKARAFETEEKARAFAATEDVADWCPLLEHRVVTMLVVTELIPLDADPIPADLEEPKS